MFKPSRLSIVFISVLLSVFVAVNYIDALTTSPTKSTTKAHRYRVTYNDVKNGTDVTFDNLFCKKLTLYTMGPSDQIISLVSNVTSRFRTPDTNAGVFSLSLRPEQSGVDVSGGFDIAMPPDLNTSKEPQLETRLGNSFQFAFYSESLSTDVVWTVCAEQSISSLTQGQIDFYVYKIE